MSSETQRDTLRNTKVQFIWAAVVLTALLLFSIGFKGSPSSPLAGSLTEIGIKNQRRILLLSFDQGEISEPLTADALSLAITPSTDASHNFSDGANLSDAITRGARVFGYKYSSVNATAEIEAKTRADNGEPLTYDELFPGTFFTSTSERAASNFIESFESQKNITFLPLAEVTLQKNERYVFVAQETGASLTVRGLQWCGNGTVVAPEECDGGDACSESCTFLPAICGDGIRQHGESCDLATQNGQTCTNSYGQTCSYCDDNCTNIFIDSPRCGDGIQQPGESCDDGNNENGDTCLSTCQNDPTTLLSMGAVWLCRDGTELRAGSQATTPSFTSCQSRVDWQTYANTRCHQLQRCGTNPANCAQNLNVDMDCTGQTATCDCQTGLSCVDGSCMESNHLTQLYGSPVNLNDPEWGSVRFEHVNKNYVLTVRFQAPSPSEPLPYDIRLALRVKRLPNAASSTQSPVTLSVLNGYTQYWQASFFEYPQERTFQNDEWQTIYITSGYRSFVPTNLFNVYRENMQFSLMVQKLGCGGCSTGSKQPWAIDGLEIQYLNGQGNIIRRFPVQDIAPSIPNFSINRVSPYFSPNPASRLEEGVLGRLAPAISLPDPMNIDEKTKRDYEADLFYRLRYANFED